MKNNPEAVSFNSPSIVHPPLLYQVKPFGKFSLPTITFLSFPQLFRRVAAALPGMESTQDRSREDSILIVLPENFIINTNLRAPLGWLRNIILLLFAARNWWFSSIETEVFYSKKDLPDLSKCALCSLPFTTVHQ